MYWEHLGFTEQPFALTPNPDFLFLSAHHQEAFAHLLYGIDNRVGFIVLSGEVGTGKTTLIRTLLNQLDPEIHRSALIFNPTLSPLSLLKEINREFGLTTASTESRELIDILNSYLLTENEADRTVLLVIDEAQNLSPEVLEQIRLISNLETERAKLIQIILVGQPELQRLLARQDLRQLDQRITVSYHLKPMGFSDTCAYITHRIKVAGNGREPVSFSTGAVRRIYAFSKGLPRLINAVCDRALLLAYTKEVRTVSRGMAADSIADIRKNQVSPPLSRGLAITLAIIVIAVVAGGMAVMSRQKPTLPPRQNETTIPPLESAAVLAELAAATPEENLLTAMNAILRAWQSPPIAPTGAMSANPKTLAKQRGFVASEVNGDIATLARFDTPALLEFKTPAGGSRLVALTGFGPRGVTLTPALGGRSTLTQNELSTIWNGRALLLWKNFHNISTRLQPGSNGKGVKSLQELLVGAGHYGGNAGDRFDEATSRALKSFQQAEGLIVDGRPGEKSLLLLYRRAGGFFPPGLSRTDLPENKIPITEKPATERKG